MEVGTAGKGARALELCESNIVFYLNTPLSAQALCRFDSRAVSLLLKDLGKAGEGARATQLFDRLRVLEPGHVLRALCDVYTYTAAIALCIHQQACIQVQGMLESGRECSPGRLGCKSALPMYSTPCCTDIRLNFILWTISHFRLHHALHPPSCSIEQSRSAACASWALAGTALTRRRPRCSWSKSFVAQWL